MAYLACFLGSALCSFAMLTSQPPFLCHCHTFYGQGITSMLPRVSYKVYAHSFLAHGFPSILSPWDFPLNVSLFSASPILEGWLLWP